MTTLLEAVNLVLTKIGENKVSTVSSNVVSRLCADNVRMALRAIIDDSTQWPWLLSNFAASSWSTYTATMPGTLINLEFVRDNGSLKILSYMEEKEFYLRVPQAYTGANGGAWWWTMVGEKILFDPYPNDATAQDRIIFHGAIAFTFPTADADVLQIPDRDLNMLIFRTCMLMATDHLMDGAKGQAYLMEYQKAAQMAKSRMAGDMTDRRRSAIW